jgi:hypothetical protein
MTALRRRLRTFRGSMMPVSVLALTFVAVVGIAGGFHGATSGPTPESALSTEEAINQALLTSNAGALETLLADGWIVVSGFGGIAERNDFIAYVRAGDFTRKRMILSEPRVRLYGNTALVTTHLNASGRSVIAVHGKIVSHCFDVKERQTDVLIWEHGSWRSVLLHETVIPGTLHVTVIPGRKSGCTTPAPSSMR